MTLKHYHFLPPLPENTVTVFMSFDSNMHAFHWDTVNIDMYL